MRKKHFSVDEKQDSDGTLTGAVGLILNSILGPFLRRAEFPAFDL